MRLPNRPRHLAAAVIAVGVGLTSGTASATAILNVVGGQLTGAQNVQVGGALYDVQFIDDSCINVFDGCDDVSDFDFDNALDAVAAGQALLDQVLLDGPEGLFDTDPTATSGCADAVNCFVFIPYGIDNSEPLFSIPSAFVQNFVDGGPNVDVAGTVLGAIPSQNQAGSPLIVWGVFTKTSEIPTPGAFWLFAVALTALAIARRRSAFATRQPVSKRT